MEKIKKLPKTQRATEDETEIKAILIGMPRAHLTHVATQFALFGRHTLSKDDQFKLQFLELPRYEYGSQSVPTLVTGPGVDLTRTLPIEMLMKVIEYIPPGDCLRLSESNKFFYQIMKEESFWNAYCEKVLRSAFKDDYAKILERNTLSYKRLALHIFGKRDPVRIYSDWQSYQRLERSKNDESIAKEIKKEIKKKKFRKIVRFDTFNAHDFEIRLTDHDYVHYFFLVTLLEYNWQIEDDQGQKSYFERSAESIKKFCEKEVEEKKKSVPIKKHKLVGIEYTILFVGFDMFQHFQQKTQAAPQDPGADRVLSSLEQVTTYFSSLLDHTTHPMRLRHIIDLLDTTNMLAVYTALIDCVEISSLVKIV